MAKRSSEGPPWVSARPSVQELRGALSLGNRIIIKQVTSGTRFSPTTSGKDNCVSVNDGRGFPGLAAGLRVPSDWLAGAGRSLVCSLLPTTSSLRLSPELPSQAPSQRRVSRRPPDRGWAEDTRAAPGTSLPQGWSRDPVEGHGGIQLPAPWGPPCWGWAVWANYEGAKGLGTVRGSQSLIGERTAARPFLLDVGSFLARVLPQHLTVSTGRGLQVPQGTAGHTPRDQAWLPGVTWGLNGFTLEAAANLPSKPHPSLQPGVWQVTAIFQFAVIRVVVSEFSGTTSTLC